MTEAELARQTSARPRPIPLLAPVIAITFSSSVILQWWSEGGIVEMASGIGVLTGAAPLWLAPFVPLMVGVEEGVRSEVAAGGIL